MDPVKAYELGVDPAEVQITCEGGRYSNKWIIWVPDEIREKYILTETHDVYAACHWRQNLEFLSNGS